MTKRKSNTFFDFCRFQLLCFQYMENTKVLSIPSIENMENTKVPLIQYLEMWKTQKYLLIAKWKCGKHKSSATLILKGVTFVFSIYLNHKSSSSLIHWKCWKYKTTFLKGVRVNKSYPTYNYRCWNQWRKRCQERLGKWSKKS